MRTIKQNYHDNFKCIADKCPQTCCSGWQIVIDEDSLDKYESYEGSIADRLNNSIDWMEGTFMQQANHDCAFLNKNGLCDLISAEGDDILCDTCRLYPRHVEEYEDLREWSLSLSCPEAVKMLTGLDDYMDFDIADDDEDDPLEEEFEDFDFILFSKLQDARDVIFDIIKNENISFADSLSIILELAKRLQESYDSGDHFTMDDILEEFTTAGSNASLEESTFNSIVAGSEGNLSRLAEGDLGKLIEDSFDTVSALERLSDDWDDYLDYIKFPVSLSSVFARNNADTNKSVIGNVGTDKPTANADTDKSVVSNVGTDKPTANADTNKSVIGNVGTDILIEGVSYEKHTLILKNILISLLYTYFLGSIYTGMIYGVTKMCIFACVFVEAIAKGKSDSLKRPVTLSEYEEILYKYSRETEHSDLNINALLEFFDL